MAMIRHNIIKTISRSSRTMFVRPKTVGGGRYLYLVEGVRDGARVKQRILCYLGPLYRVSSGVPETKRRRIDSRLNVDWKKVNDEIGRIPLTFEEVAQARRAQFARSIRAKGEKGGRTQGVLPRAEGELSALSRLASVRFDEMFEEVGDGAFKMR